MLTKEAINSSPPSADYIYVSMYRVNIGSDNGLSPGQRKPLSEPMLEYC